MDRDSRQEPIANFITRAVETSLRNRSSTTDLREFFLSIQDGQPVLTERRVQILSPGNTNLPEYVADGKLEDCTICLSEITSGEKIKVLPCSATVNHKFHSKCIDTWTTQGKTTCPNCRSNFTDNI
jgi:hypothetical protein